MKISDLIKYGEKRTGIIIDEQSLINDIMINKMISDLIDRIAKVMIKSQEDSLREMKNLNEWVREARRKCNLTMKQVAAEYHTSEATICRYEGGKRTIPVSYIRYWVDKGIPFNWEDMK